MPIAWKTVVLAGPQELLFGDYEPIVVERVDAESLDLRVTFLDGRQKMLQGAVDTDERFLDPRITIFTGTDSAEMLLFGGPQAYRLRSDGKIVDRIATLRDLEDYECGSLEVVLHDNLAVIVYEVGILVIDDRLTPRWLRRKYMGRGNIEIADGLLCLREPFTRPIKHRLSDGELVSRHRSYGPGVARNEPPDDREIVACLLHSLDGRGLASALTAIETALARWPHAAPADEMEALKQLIAREQEAIKHCDPDDPGDGASLDRLIDHWLAIGGELAQLRDLTCEAIMALWRDSLSIDPVPPGAHGRT